MRIAFVGKGGSGKTTVSSIFLRYLMSENHSVLAIDADINQHLANAIGWNVGDIPELGNNLTDLKTTLLGSNKLIPSANLMNKTSLPGPGSNMIKINKDDPVLKKFAKKNDEVWFMRVGGFNQEDLGQRCFHAKTGSVELILNHLADTKDEFVIVDMTAGADAFASGLFSRFDLTLLVVEPTIKSMSVYKQYKKYAKDYNICIKVVGNKVTDENDIDFLKENCGDDLIGSFSLSNWVKKAERGTVLDFQELELENFSVLKRIAETTQTLSRDWQKYWKTGIKIHNINAIGWANADSGCDIKSHIDEDYLMNFKPAY